jgi:hypothetical protein
MVAILTHFSVARFILVSTFEGNVDVGGVVLHLQRLLRLGDLTKHHPPLEP